MNTISKMAAATTAARSRKRKALKQASQRAAKRAKTAAMPPTTTKPFQFFDLPAELRNLVYQKIVQEQTASIGGRLTDHSGLLPVHAIPQLSDEYIPVLLLYASRLKATVIDFEFGKRVTFINRLSDAEVNTLPTATKSGTRKIDIHLNISYDSKGSGVKGLRRWLNRAGHPRKKGTTLDISYTFSRVAHHSYVADWVRVLNDYNEGSDNERAKEEAEKIKTGLTK